GRARPAAESRRRAAVFWWTDHGGDRRGAARLPRNRRPRVDAGQSVAVRGTQTRNEMNPDQWARVKDVFHAALERSPEERTTFITRMCDGDPILQAEVQRLLAAHAEAGGFIERSPSLGARQSLTGRIFGRYELGRAI